MFINELFPNDNMFEAFVTKKESVLNKGVEKIFARVKQWEAARDEAVKYQDRMPPMPREEVAVIVADHPTSIGYGVIKQMGRSGLVHVKLMGGELKDWASKDVIAVRPNEIYATWDPSLRDKTVVHRVYNNDGSRRSQG